MREGIAKEIQYIRGCRGIKVASIGTTARLLADFLVLPRRTYSQFSCINFLVSSENDAAYCLRQVDGVVDYVLVDVESKQQLDLMAVASEQLNHSVVVAYKPNDASVEAADLLVRQHLKDNMAGENILILGSGNIASKLALRLCERNAVVHMYARNYQKLQRITNGLNAILPQYSPNRIQALSALPAEADIYSVLVSFVASDHYVQPEAADLVMPGGLAIDGGINNLSPGFLELSQTKGYSCIRLDVRLGFAYSLLSMGDDVMNFNRQVKGERIVDGIRLLAGGIIGRRGDVIVDRIANPSQIIGIANGVGGVVRAENFSREELQRMETIQNCILRPTS